MEPCIQQQHRCLAAHNGCGRGSASSCLHRSNCGRSCWPCMPQFCNWSTLHVALISSDGSIRSLHTACCVCDRYSCTVCYACAGTPMHHHIAPSPVWVDNLCSEQCQQPFGLSVQADPAMGPEWACPRYAWEKVHSRGGALCLCTLLWQGSGKQHQCCSGP